MACVVIHEGGLVTCAAALIGFKFRDNLEAGLTASQAEPGSAFCEKAGHVSWLISRFPLLMPTCSIGSF
jgi:hypothetical protein